MPSGNPDYGFEIPSGGLDLVGAAYSDIFLRGRVVSQSFAQYSVTYAGQQAWGPGNAAVDSYLFRAGVGVMRFVSGLEVTDLFYARGSCLVAPGTPGAVALKVKLLNAQTADAIQVENYLGTVLFGVDKSGNVAAASLGLTTPLPVASGGTGEVAPSLVAGANITITGSWPNNTIALSSPIASPLTVGNGTGTAFLTINGAAGYLRSLYFHTNGVARWILYTDSSPEGGSNAGSDLYFGRFNDAGGWIKDALCIRRSDGQVGIGTASPKSALHVVGLPVYANNAAAVAGGLTAGAFYRTGADPDPVCVVH